MTNNDQTENYKLPLPHPDNTLSEDILRLRASLQAADQALFLIARLVQSGQEDVVQKIQELLNQTAPASTALSNAIWTDGRALKIDALDTAVSSRAPADTALSNATWTATRASNLDRLDTTVSTRAPADTALSNDIWTDGRAGMLDRIPSLPTGCVKSVMMGYYKKGGLSVSGTATAEQKRSFQDHPPVNVAKSLVFLQGVTATQQYSSSLLPNEYIAIKERTATSFTVNDAWQNGSVVYYPVFHWQLIEFY